MDRIRILQRIRQLKASKSPRAIRLGTLLLAFSYPAFFALLIVLGVALMAAGVVAKRVNLGVIFGAVIAATSARFLLRAFRASSLNMPPARVLSIEEAAKIRETTVEICRTLGCRPPHRIEVDDEENASVYLVKCGFFSYKPVLRLGLPLLMALRPEEFRPVIAHECGHLLRYDDLWGRLLHRLEMGWLAGTHGTTGAESPHFWSRWFALWFWPRLRAWIAADARMGEQHADAASARLFPGAGAAKARVCVIASTGSKLCEQWFSETIEALPEPPALYTRRRLEQIRFAWNRDEAGRQLAAMLAAPDNEFAAHPTVAQILELASESPSSVSLDPPPPAEHSAAAFYLGAFLDPIEAELDAEKRAAGRKGWGENHSLRKRARLEIAAATDKTGIEAAELLASAWLNLGCQDMALPHLRAIRASRPRDADAALALANAALATDAPDAPDVARTVIADFPQHTGTVMEGLSWYYARRGDTSAAREALEEHFRFFDRADAVRTERGTLQDREALEPHQLGPDALAQLKVALLQHHDLAEVRIGAKRLSDFKNSPIHVVLLRYSGATRGSAELQRQRNQELANQFSQLVGECFFCSNRAYPKLWKKASKIEGARLFVRD